MAFSSFPKFPCALTIIALLWGRNIQGCNENNQKMCCPAPAGLQESENITTIEGVVLLNYSQLVEELRSLKAVLIDVRSKEERSICGSIPGSNNLPIEEFEDALDLHENKFFEKYDFPKPQMNDHIVLTCKIGKRATKASKLMTRRGFAHLQVYPGILDWKRNRGSLNTIVHLIKLCKVVGKG